ncbi:glycosyltransferase family 9 protein [Rugamonas fusca]|uniref:glycosyltransferase family 9 protein n=1 Tax=Rugamonas fusca TaxID=2758568 RepID=UPI001E4920AE|nr:glycosyltransferase family 9 protein [Rugamonas fusca]
MPPQLNHILICRTDNIGDVVLSLPLAGYLKQRFPGVRVDLLCSAYAAPVARRCRHLDQVYALEQVGDPAAFFAAHGADTVIFAMPNRRLAQAARRARVRNRVGTSHRLFHWIHCNRLAHFGRAHSALHEAQLNFALLRPLGVDEIPPLASLPPLYGLTAPQRDDVAALRAATPHAVILHPKSNGNGREWPLAHYTELARRLQARPDVRLWVTGSAAEGALLAAQAPALLALPNVDNLCGRYDLEGLCALIGASTGLVASGTGPLHMSAALGQPTLGLFPPRKPIDAARWGALGVRARSLTMAGECAGCRDAATCTCMHAITPAQVEQAVLDWCAPVIDQEAV